jgi:hypothetical protein
MGGMGGMGEPMLLLYHLSIQPILPIPPIQ